MRLVKIENCSYEKYNAIRNAIYQNIPFALINNEYSKELRTAYFNFWDSDYIPEQLRKHIVQPPADRENTEKMLQEILDATK